MSDYIAHIASDANPRYTLCGEPWQGWQLPLDWPHDDEVRAPHWPATVGTPIHQCQACLLKMTRPPRQHPRMELRMMVLYFCPGRIVAQYDVKGGSLDGQSVFCDVLRSRWFREFNTAEAVKCHIQPPREKPDIVFEDGALKVQHRT